jgi:hypothetical protein
VYNYLIPVYNVLYPNISVNSVWKVLNHWSVTTNKKCYLQNKNMMHGGRKTEPEYCHILGSTYPNPRVILLLVTKEIIRSNNSFIFEINGYYSVNALGTFLRANPVHCNICTVFFPMPSMNCFIYLLLPSSAQV